MEKYIFTSFSKRIDNSLSKVKSLFQNEEQSTFIHLIDLKKDNKKFKVQLNKTTEKITKTLVEEEESKFKHYIISEGDNKFNLLSEAIKAFLENNETLYIASSDEVLSEFYSKEYYQYYYKRIIKLINKLINRCINIKCIAINYMDLILTFILIQIFSSFSIEEDKNVRLVIRHEYLLH